MLLGLIPKLPKVRLESRTGFSFLVCRRTRTRESGRAATLALNTNFRQVEGADPEMLVRRSFFHPNTNASRTKHSCRNVTFFGSGNAGLWWTRPTIRHGLWARRASRD